MTKTFRRLLKGLDIYISVGRFLKSDYVKVNIPSSKMYAKYKALLINISM